MSTLGTKYEVAFNLFTFFSHNEFKFILILQKKTTSTMKNEDMLNLNRRSKSMREVSLLKLLLLDGLNATEKLHMIV